MIRNDTECGLELQCGAYDVEIPCEKPSYRFMRKPICYLPKKDRLISRLAEGIFNIIKKSTRSITGGKLE